MDESRQDASSGTPLGRGVPAGLALRTLTRLRLNEGVPAYLAALAVFLLLLILGAVR